MAWAHFECSRLQLETKLFTVLQQQVLTSESFGLACLNQTWFSFNISKCIPPPILAWVGIWIQSLELERTRRKFNQPGVCLHLLKNKKMNCNMLERWEKVTVRHVGVTWANSPSVAGLQQFFKFIRNLQSRLHQLMSMLFKLPINFADCISFLLRFQQFHTSIFK